MIVKHTFQVRAVCPINGDIDQYECEVSLTTLVVCETLIAEAAEYKDRSLYQEQLTLELAERWNATVRTKGTHVGGEVATECTAFPKSLVSVRGS